MIPAVHRFLDRTSRKTYTFERLVSLGLEALLLLACALPVVHSVRSAGAQLMIAALQLHVTELRRELASIEGRHAEAGGVTPLPARKAGLARRLGRHLEIASWAWPGLAAVVSAAEARSVAAASIVALLATLARVAWGRVVFPAWRRSRVAWRAAQIAPWARRAQRLAEDGDAPPSSPRESARARLGLRELPEERESKP